MKRLKTWILFLAVAAPLNNAATEWYNIIKIKEDAVNQQLQDIRARTFEPSDQEQKQKMAETLQNVDEKLIALRGEIDRNRQQKFKEGSDATWMSMIQKADDLQISNQVNDDNLKKHLKGKEKNE